MSTAQELERTIGQDVYDVDGQKVGTAANLYASDLSGEPEWVTVRTGLFGNKETFVPLAGAHAEQDGLHVGAHKDAIKDAPRIDDQGHLSEAEAAELYRHYNLQSTSRNTRSTDGLGMATGDGVPADQQQNAGMKHARADHGREEVVRSEERLRAGTETVETGRVRLHKHVVTEEQQVTVPVSHEEVRVVREPIEHGRPGAEIAPEDREVTLHEERPVVAKETVPVEKVGLDTKTVRDEQQVREQVRKEQVDVVDADLDEKTPRKH
ncbi:hypothetical protein Kfla_0886 [Kribbella flavida DSM 17836]|uniref:PRC-barrel domain protein n=1 Tax=Kribbella flavida (strain DSM 17836 / JCM 10339 / NBRC 14399) TaxID=479435 RepID=D2PZZ3_KRIFD|nr:PRC and DUF2382 domain-containing protein [Kribbella flavida]ADB29991.1 hypothetical protein Kfla_0886 [Kribbella flavida DSM 17836]